jgi:DNA-binding LacI/PurR family transcriptional regulator
MDEDPPRPAAELTMDDIARMAGVSKSTVSRALAGSTRISAETRGRIVELARRSRYTVNEGARSLRQRRTRTIEVLIPIEPDNAQPVSDPFFLDLLGAIADALSAREHDLLLSKSAPWLRPDGANSLVSGRADGIIVIGQGRRLPELRALAQAHAPIVVWGAHLPGEPYTIVGGDNRGGGALATGHLLRLGRRRIAFLGDPTLPETRLRHEGYVQALQDAGLAPDPRLTAASGFDARGAFAAAQALQASVPDLDGVVAGSDVIAMSAIAALGAAGVASPRDVGVVGYDDASAAAWFNPALTTISQSIRAGGEALVEALFAKLEGRPAQNVLLPARLIVRSSCGA